jgi:hypothetical protein
LHLYTIRCFNGLGIDVFFLTPLIFFEKMKSLFLSFLLLTCMSLRAQTTSDVLEAIGEYGVINWTAQYVEAVGTSIVNHDKFKDPQQAQLMAIRGAEVVAKANLLEAVSGVKVIRETTVKDMMIESDNIKTSIEGTIRGTRTIGKPKIEGNAVTITVRMALYGTNGLADVVAEKASEKSDAASESTKSSTNPTNDATVPAPTPKKQLDTNTPQPDDVKPTPTPSTTPSGNSGKKKGSTSGTTIPASDATKAPTVTPEEATKGGVVFKFEGDKFDPALFPIIIDENDNVLFDLSKYYATYIKDGGNVPKYVQIGKDAMKKGVEIIEAVQTSKGVIKISSKGKPKLKKWLETTKKVGNFVLPILKLFL